MIPVGVDVVRIGVEATLPGCRPNSSRYFRHVFPVVVTGEGHIFHPAVSSTRSLQASLFLQQIVQISRWIFRDGRRPSFNYSSHFSNLQSETWSHRVWPSLVSGCRRTLGNVLGTRDVTDEVVAEWSSCHLYGLGVQLQLLVDAAECEILGLVFTFVIAVSA